MSTPVGDSWSLPALEHTSTIEQTHRVLRNAIVDGSISQGAHLREIHLAQSLGTSRGTVREAIRQLVQEGVAIRILRSDAPLELDGLEAAMADLRAAAKGQARPTEEVIAADLRFHQELVRLVRSPRLDRAYATLAAETRMLLRHHPEYPWRTYVSDHEKLLEAVERRDPDLPDIVAAHLVLSADLIGAEIAAEPRAGGRR
jgi:DNA-binding GntR family transcriptional regulator